MVGTGLFKSNEFFLRVRGLCSRLHPASAAEFPQKGKSIQVMVHWAAGGSSDLGARILAAGLEKELGTSVLVVNKPGAGGQIGYTALSQAKPDGYTIGSTNFPSAVSSYLDPNRKATYNRKSFELLALHVADPGIIAVKVRQSLQDPPRRDQCRKGGAEEAEGHHHRHPDR